MKTWAMAAVTRATLRLSLKAGFLKKRENWRNPVVSLQYFNPR